jgi:hypothetical protein
LISFPPRLKTFPRQRRLGAARRRDDHYAEDGAQNQYLPRKGAGQQLSQRRQPYGMDNHISTCWYGRRMEEEEEEEQEEEEEEEEAEEW